LDFGDQNSNTSVRVERAGTAHPTRILYLYYAQLLIKGLKLADRVEKAGIIWIDSVKVASSELLDQFSSQSDRLGIDKVTQAHGSIGIGAKNRGFPSADH
jgi:hypothetical protein